MASTVTVEAHRRRFSVKAGPMTPLSAVVSDVLTQLQLAGPPLRPEDCQLLLKGKPLDLGMPLRFAGVGRDKLELKTGREQVLGVVEAPKPAAPTPAPPSSTPPTAAAAAAASAPPPQQVPAPAAAAPSPPAPQQQQQQAQQAVHQQRAAAGPSLQSQQEQQPGASSSAPAAASAPAPSQPLFQQAQAAASAAPAAEPGWDDAHPSVALFGRRVWVFTRQAEQQAESEAAPVQEVDDSFYEFNETDLRRAMASAAASRAKQEGGHLMTAAMREKEERRRAESYGDVPIRLYLPDGQHCLQTALPATAPLSAVLALARAALAPVLAGAAYLFTTPPRTVLKDLSPSLYTAKMVPAAKVHVGLDAAKASAAQQGQQLLRPEVLALAEAPPQRAAVMHARQQQQQQQAGAGAGTAGGAAAARMGAASGASQPQKGVPKWLKLGGK